MKKKATIYCICNEASKENCTDANCLKHKKLQPTSCLNCDSWKRTDDTRPSIFSFHFPEGK